MWRRYSSQLASSLLQRFWNWTRNSFWSVGYQHFGLPKYWVWRQIKDSSQWNSDVFVWLCLLCRCDRSAWPWVVYHSFRKKFWNFKQSCQNKQHERKSDALERVGSKWGIFWLVHGCIGKYVFTFECRDWRICSCRLSNVDHGFFRIDIRECHLTRSACQRYKFHYFSQ